MREINIADSRDILVVVLMYLLFVESIFSNVLAADSPNTEGKGSAYGVVLRKQSIGNRVMIQPLEGTFIRDADIQYRNNTGDVVCVGKVQTVYPNLVYSVAEGCDKFDDVRSGFGVTFNTDGKEMLAIYNSKDKIDTVVRENEWKRCYGIPMDIGEEQFENIVKKSNVPVLFEIYATWCPRCTEFGPIIAEVAKDLQGTVRVAIADGEKNRALKKELGVEGFPSVFLFIDGVIVDKWAGAYKDKTPVLDRINNKLKRTDKK